MKNNSKPVVAHYISDYLFLTGSWIHSQLVNHNYFTPIVLSYNPSSNLDMYPFHPIYCYSELSFTQKLLVKLKSRHFDSVFEEYCYQVFKKNDVQVVHCHFGNSGMDMLNLQRKLGFSLVVSFYGADMSFLAQDPEWRKKYQVLFKEANLFLVEGAHSKRVLIELGCPEEKVKIQHLGVDLQSHPFYPRIISKDGKIRILVAGTFREKKGIPYALQAYAAIIKKHPNVELTLLGDSAGLARDELEKKKIMDIIAENNLESRIKLLGFRPFSEFKQLLLDHHIFLSPSVTAADGDSEGGAPVSITEASATGMPVVSSLHADIPEVILDGESGYLSAERDIESLIEDLDRAISHPEKWAEIAKAGRAYIEKEFNCISQVEKLEAIYRKLIN